MKPTSPRSFAPIDDCGQAARLPDTAMVFAAGRGVRMQPLTNQIPKPLVEIAGRSLLDRVLDSLAQAGVATAIVNVHHLAEQIERRLEGRTRPRIVISDERERLLDQGGGIKKVLPLLQGRPFFICNTDAFWTGARADNIRRLAAIWDAEKMDAALLLAPAIGSVDWDGDFDMDEEGRLTKRAGENKAPFVYAGVGVIKPELFAAIEEDVFPLAPFFFEAARRGRLFGVELDGTWRHVGTIAAIEEAERAIAEAKCMI